MRATAATLLFIFAACIAAVHIVEGYPPITTTLSEFAIGPFGAIMRVGFIAFGVAGWVTNLLLRSADVRGRAFLGLFAIGMLGVAMLNTDPGDRPTTMHGLEHSISAVVVFFSLPLAVWLGGSRSLALRVTATAQAAAAIALLAGPSGISGATELVVTALALAEFSLLLAVPPQSPDAPATL